MNETNTGLSVHLKDNTERIFSTGYSFNQSGEAISLRVDTTEITFFGTIEQLQKIVGKMSSGLTEAVNERDKKAASERLRTEFVTHKEFLD